MVLLPRKRIASALDAKESATTTHKESRKDHIPGDHYVTLIDSHFLPPPLDDRPVLSLDGLSPFSCPFFSFCRNCCVSRCFPVNVSLLATEVLRCWSSSQAGFFFFGELPVVKKRLNVEGFFPLDKSLSSFRNPPPLLLLPDNDAGVALLLRFEALLRKGLKNGMAKNGFRTSTV